MSELRIPQPEDAFDRLPPHDINAEICTLGSLMLAGNDAVIFAEVGQMLNADDFYRADHAIIFTAIREMQAKNEPIDAVTVRARLIQRGQFEEIGGLKYLADLINAVPSHTHAAHYARIVRQKSLGRQMVHLFGEGLRRAYAPMAPGEEYNDLLNHFAGKVTQLAAGGNPQQIRRLGEIAMEWYEEASTGHNAPMIQTGLTDLDDMIGGLPIGGFAQIWARPSMGKSGFIRTIARILAVAGTPIGIVSIEEKERKIATNAVSAHGGVNSWRMQKNQLNAQEMSSSLEAINELYNAPFFVADKPAKLSEVEAAATLMVHRHKCRVVFVDHIHLINGEIGRHENRTQEITKISGALKAVAKRLNVCIVAACQLNRSTERGKELPPTLSSGRDSGALEQDADLIIGLHREDQNRTNTGEPKDNEMQAIILKNRPGKTGKVRLRWDGDHQRVEDWEPSNNDPELPL